MSLIKLKNLNLWGNKKIYLLILFSILSVILFFCFNILKIQSESQELTKQMENQLYWGGSNPYTDFNKDLWGQEAELHLDIFKKKYSYYESWRKQKISEFQLREQKFLDRYPQFYSLAQNKELGIFLDDNLYPLPEYAINRDRVINSLNSNKQLLKSTRYGKEGSSFLTAIIPVLTSFVGFTLYLLLFGEVISGDFENGTIRLLFTNKTSRLKYMLTSIILTVFYTYLFFLFLLVLSYSLAAFFYGSGQVDYPLFSPQLEIEFIKSYDYWINVSVIFLFTLIFMITVYFIVCLCFPNTISAIVITIVGLLFLNRVSYLSIFKYIAKFNPFLYLSPSEIFIGRDYSDAYFITEAHDPIDFAMIVENSSYYLGENLSTLLEDNRITFFSGIISLFIGSVMLLILGNYLLKNKMTYH